MTTKPKNNDVITLSDILNISEDEFNKAAIEYHEALHESVTMIELADLLEITRKKNNPKNINKILKAVMLGQLMVRQAATPSKLLALQDDIVERRKLAKKLFGNDTPDY